MTECLLTDLDVGKCSIRTGITEEMRETETERFYCGNTYMSAR